MKDHLLFVIDFSLRAISTNNNDNEKKENEDKNKDKENKKGEKENGNTENKKEEEIANTNKKNEDQLLNFNLNEDNYYGLNLLLNYLSEEQYKKYSMTNEQKIELINSSIE